MLPQALIMNQSSTGPKFEGSGDVRRSKVFFDMTRILGGSFHLPSRLYPWL